MNVKTFKEQYLRLLQQKVEPESAEIFRKKIPFFALSAKEENGKQSYRLRCPICGEVFDYTGRVDSRYNQCPTCCHAPGSVYMKDEIMEHLNFLLTISLPATDQIVVAPAKADIRYSYSSNKIELQPTFEIKNAFSDAAILSADEYEYFDIINEKRSKVKNLYEAFTYRYDNRNSPALYSPSEIDLSNWMSAHGYSSDISFWAYHRHCMSVRSAAPVKKPSTTLIQTVYESMLPSYDKSIVENEYVKHTFVYTNEEKDLTTDELEMYIICCNCGNDFYIKTNLGENRYDGKCPNCGMKARKHIKPNYLDKGWRSGESSRNLQYAFVQPYIGSITDNNDGIIIRSYELSCDIRLTAENDPLYAFTHTPRTICFYNIKKKDFRSFAWNEEEKRYNSDRSGDESYDLVYVDVPGTRSFLDFSGLKELIDHTMAKNNDEWEGSRWRYRSNSLSLRYIRRFLDARNKYPVIEKLVKIGLYEYVDNLVDPPSFSTKETADFMKAVLSGKDTVQEALGLSMPLINGLKDKIISRHTLLDILEFVKIDPNITPEIIRYFIDMNISSGKLKNAVDATGTSVRNIQTYLENVRCFQAYEPCNSISDWIDYVNVAKEIGMDMKDKYVLYPRSLKRDHDVAMSKKRLIRDEKISEAFIEQVERAKNLYAYKTQTTLYEVRPPKDIEELFEEGRKLSHSVGSYGDAIASGKMCIMFVRNVNTPDVPYFTVEVDEANASIVQLRSFSNRLIDVVEERPLADFIKQWGKMKHLDTSLVLPKKFA